MAPAVVPETLLDVIHSHAASRAGSVAYRFLKDGEGDGATVTFAQLHDRASSLGAHLRAHGLEGRPVLILCPEGLEYVTALVGCWYAGAIAVPAYPPTRGSAARVLPRIRSILRDVGAQAALTTLDVEGLLGSLELTDGLTVWQVEALLTAASLSSSLVAQVSEQTPALLQYTSGSTSEPKGVLITHGQLLANQEMLCAWGQPTERDVVISWLPPFHDMGLIGGIVLPLYLGLESVMMPAAAFLRRPKRWLVAAQRHRATILMAPNFAFDVCVDRVRAAEREQLDLSAWRLVCTGAEPINARTLDAFTDAFSPCGFRREAFQPTYGMAEATLIISAADPLSAPLVRDYDAGELERGRGIACLARDGGSRRLVGCGRALLDERIVIVDPETRRELAAQEVGEIWVRSRSVALGYWRRPDESERVFHAHTAAGDGPYLRTGDLGFMDAGELYVTGRTKDLIIVRGLNHYPQDIERTVQAAHPALVRDGGAAFGVSSGGDGERLVVVQELDRRSSASTRDVLAAMARAIAEQHGITASELVLIKRGSSAKTSSGKVQRALTRRAYLDGELEVIARWSSVADERPQSGGGERASDSTATRSHVRPATRRQPKEIEAWLVGFVANRLERPASSIDISAPFASLGVDSLLGAELTEALEQWLGAELPSSISYDSPTIASLASALGAVTSPLESRAPRRAPRRHTDDAVAIVGMACRLPGAPDLESFWRLLRSGGDAITEVPASRWDAAALYEPSPCGPGRICSKVGGFIDGAEQFDAEFFGISAREAARIDPQQRWFLETAWAALEDAGVSPVALARTLTGVFAGVSTSDYASLQRGDLRTIDPDYGTGTSNGLVANRLSYLLDLKGPSETLDTACSSSLVALKHACRNLRDGDCDLALVGGVNAVLAPEVSVYFSQLRALSPSGRCRTFDRNADGFVRSEGVGVVVLCRLDDALARRDRIYAVIAGSAVNHDGRSNGILAPNGLAQQALIRSALAGAGIEPADLDYVEAHGVGTPVADAVELHALGQLMGERAEPLCVGSLKTNVGHLEAASGVASVIKVALALHHEQIPAHLHLEQAHPDIALERLPITIPTLPVAWPRSERTRYAGVSAFGFGGTNAHVVLREAPPAAAAVAARVPSVGLLALSAKTPSALRALAKRYATALARRSSTLALHDVCYTAATGRAHFRKRLALTATSIEQLVAGLSGLAWGADTDTSLHADPAPRVAFVFPDEAPEPGDCAELYATEPTFRAALDRCDQLLSAQLERGIGELLYGARTPERSALLARPSHAAVAVVALQWGFHELWRSWGVVPSAVYGMGAGEYAAAAAASVLDWEQAVACALRRGLLLESLVPHAQQYMTLRKFRAELARLSFRAPAIAFVSATLKPGELPDAAYFSRQAYQSTTSAASDALGRVECELELCLGRADALCLDPPIAGRTRLGLSRARCDQKHLLDLLARAYERGVDIDWQAFHAATPGRKVSLPSYPFERQRHWLTPLTPDATPSARTRTEVSPHPLIGRVRTRAGVQLARSPRDED